MEVHPTIGRNDHILLPALAEGTEDPHHVGQQNGPNDEVAVDARLAEVDLAAENGGQPAPNEQLQHMEQEDLQGNGFLIKAIGEITKWMAMANVT